MTEPDRSSELAAVSAEARAFFAQKHAARERALSLSRAVGQQSANAIRSAHRHEFEEARALLESARGAVAEMREAQEAHPDVYYAGFVQDSQKEYAEAHATLAFITRAPLPTPGDLGVAYAAYLNGLGEAIGEMRRFILDSLRHGDSSRCEELLDLMDGIYTQLFTMDFPEAITGGLRRTTDAMRGILERTRGDLTTALGQQALEQRIAGLWQRLGESALD